jgi:ABC-type multidrug transport system fused ATPase/permease subunit
VSDQQPNPDTQPPALACGDAREALQRYRDRLGDIENTHLQLQATDAKFGTLRVILFCLSAGLALLGAFSQLGWVAGYAAIAAFATFFVIVVLNEPVRDKMDALRRTRGVVRRLIARLERDWDTLATKRLTESLESIQLPDHQQAVADDLDLLGPASLFHLVSMTATMPGIRTLATWLTEQADAEAAKERTEAINVLAPRHDDRMRFYSLAREVGESTGTPDRFVEWASGERWLESRKWLSIWANVSLVVAVAFLLGLIVGIFGLLPATVLKTCGIGLIALAGLNMLLTSAMLGPAHAIFSIAMSNRQAVDNYQEIFAAANWLPESPERNGDGCLARIRRVILDGDQAAQVGMNQLQKVAAAGGLRQSAATFLLYLPLQAFGLWDVRVLQRLETWQSKFGPSVGDWFDALGELESLVSLAAVRDEYPQWATPRWIQPPEPQIVKATSIGHPLLNDESRVTNDVSVGPPGTILLVTGSNMSGKSTMLRSVGLNVALAGTGAPVCASQFQLPSVELATSIRVRDNVAEGVSFYMAELQRLKSVVEQARRLADVPDRVALFLLDEILQGTNSRERQIAVVQVLRHLRDSGAIGAISTHDLELADEPEMMSIAKLVHFRETIRPDAQGDEQMTFDYKMREGVSPTTNALRLLEIVGLGEK